MKFQHPGYSKTTLQVVFLCLCAEPIL